MATRRSIRLGGPLLRPTSALSFGRAPTRGGLVGLLTDWSRPRDHRRRELDLRLVSGMPVIDDEARRSSDFNGVWANLGCRRLDKDQTRRKDRGGYSLWRVVADKWAAAPAL